MTDYCDLCGEGFDYELQDIEIELDGERGMVRMCELCFDDLEDTPYLD